MSSSTSDDRHDEASPTTPPKVYEKAASFVYFRHGDVHRETVRRMLVDVQDQVKRRNVSDYASEIVGRACHDLLDPESESEDRFELRDYIIDEMTRLRDDEVFRYLFYRYRYEVLPKAKKLDNFPPCLQIEPTSICNYRCVFCYQTDPVLTKPANGHMGLMSLELFRALIDEAEGCCEAVTLASRGEPLLHPDIEAMLRYTGGKFLAMKLNTNASLLDERKCHAVLEAGVNTVVFSVDAATEPLYSRLRVRGKLDRVLANIRRFQEIRHRHYHGSRTITRVSGVKFCEEQRIDEMQRFWGGLVDQIAFVVYNPWENTYDRPVNEIQTPCSDLWRRMFVWWDGRVNPCDVDYRSTLSVGVYPGSGTALALSDMWRGPSYEGLRQNHLSRQRQTVFPCNRCVVV